MNSLLSLLFPQIPVSNFTSLFLVCLVPFCLSNKDLRVLHAAEQSQSPATGYKLKKRLQCCHLGCGAPITSQ